MNKQTKKMVIEIEYTDDKNRAFLPTKVTVDGKVVKPESDMCLEKWTIRHSKVYSWWFGVELQQY